ncbi:hypothetical protein E3P92_03828 [Wallemia ichthyophaga]|nr:hypothetical protein E3P91_03863 [Wallemia ichthyophaga]TIB08260.1 hypothetical protein E3P92_03828 [Wallemia ichthyophaga]TIB58605.1 hypothetical protein E3P78_03866 [Wallemia ichthyophaga]
MVVGMLEKATSLFKHHRKTTRMLFCPTCSNMLISAMDEETTNNKWTCSICPYQFPMTKQFNTRHKLRRKEVDDVLGGEETWKNVDQTDAECPKCSNLRAFFMQIQIRSADEPMTTFYRCTNAKCANQWVCWRCSAVVSLLRYFSAIAAGVPLGAVYALHFNRRRLEALAIGSYEKHSPLILALLHHLDHPLFWISLDATTAYAVSKLSRPCAAVYMHNPLTLLTTVARSSVSLQNALVLCAVSLAHRGRALPALTFLSLAGALFMYPAALLPPLIMVLLRRECVLGTARLLSIFLATTTAAVSLSRYIAADWTFLSLYTSLVRVDDLTPNTGVFWYLLVEMFEQFKGFFTLVLQLHTVVVTLTNYCTPNTQHSHRPLLAYTFLAGTLAIFKSYPCIGDVGVFVTLLPLFSDLFQHARHPVFVVALTATAAGLLPLFRYLWLRVVTGNANFYYASTLLWTFSNGLVLTELLYAEARRVFVDRTAHEKIDVSKYDIRQV